MKHVIHRDWFELHDAFAARLDNLMQRLHEKNLPFDVFEMYRTPARQAYLYSKGRFGPFASKNIVTRARPWGSFHNYGLAADIVIRDPKWSWRSSPWWGKLRGLARECGLVTLRKEAPHVQFPWSLRDLRNGIYPPEGGEMWARLISDSIVAHPRRAPKQPPAVQSDDIERPRITCWG